MKLSETAEAGFAARFERKILAVNSYFVHKKVQNYGTSLLDFCR